MNTNAAGACLYWEVEMTPTKSATLGGDDMMIDAVRDHIRQSAEATPQLVALRFSGSPITFGDLDSTISGYESTLAGHSLSQRSAFFAALMNLIPALSAIDNHTELMRVVNEIVAWLARDVDIDTTARTGVHLRAVG